jgi:hypothetical protein
MRVVGAVSLEGVIKKGQWVWRREWPIPELAPRETVPEVKSFAFQKKALRKS